MATSLAAQAGPTHTVSVCTSAADYDDLIDHPVEMGDFDAGQSFEACGVPHDMVALTGRFDCERRAPRARDLEAHLRIPTFRFWGEPAPMDYYLFQVMVVGDGYGGLEHRASTSLVAKRDSLPKPGQEGDQRRLPRVSSACAATSISTPGT